MKQVLKRLPVPLLVCVMLFTSCSSGMKANDSMEFEKFDSFVESSAASGSAMMDFAYSADMNQKVEMETASATKTPEATNGQTVNDLSSRKVIRTAHLNYETREFEQFVEEIQTAIRQHGGYIESSESRGQGVNKYATRYSRFTVRIPAERYDAFMSMTCEFGTQTYKNETVDDKTMEYVDIESHIKALETEYTTLLAILEKASSLDDVIQLQSRITEVNYRLDSYKSQLRKYDDLIAYCTVYINIDEVYRETQNQVTMTFGEQIASGLENTFLDIGDDLSEFTIWFVTSLPYLIIWAVIIAAAILALRLVIRKIRRKKEIKEIDRMLQHANEHDNPSQNS